MAAVIGVNGEVRVPGDKSISHRALILGALARGESVVRGVLRSADVQSTAGVLRALGAELAPLGDITRVRGVGRRGLRESAAALDCGNSGTTARLMSGVLAAHPMRARLVGDASLSRRPMRRVAEPLTRMGARFSFERGGDGLPVHIDGGDLAPLEWTTQVASAQVKSALLLAGLVAGVRVVVHEPQRSRDHTERLLAGLGVPVTSNGTTAALDPAPPHDGFELGVPGDPSSAAFFVALAALAARGSIVVRGVGLNPTRTGFLDAVRRMGGVVEVVDQGSEHGEVVGDLRVAPGVLSGISVGAAAVPAMVDELPMLACLAARAEGETVITGAAELRAKESDRIAVVVANLRAVGAEADELPDGLRVRGTTAGLRGRVATHGDHRIAMAFGVLSAATGGAIEVDDPACVDVSYPAFWSDLRRVVC